MFLQVLRPLNTKITPWVTCTFGYRIPSILLRVCTAMLCSAMPGTEMSYAPTRHLLGAAEVLESASRCAAFLRAVFSVHFREPYPASLFRVIFTPTLAP